MAMDVDSSSLQRLLDLQTEDSAIARLEHQRDSLPEAARLAEVRDQLAELESDLGIARQRFDDVQREVSGRSRAKEPPERSDRMGLMRITPLFLPMIAICSNWAAAAATTPLI